MSVLITNIGELVTNAPNGIGPGPFTSASGAALVMEAGVVAWTGIQIWWTVKTEHPYVKRP